MLKNLSDNTIRVVHWVAWALAALGAVWCLLMVVAQTLVPFKFYVPIETILLIGVSSSFAQEIRKRKKLAETDSSQEPHVR